MRFFCLLAFLFINFPPVYAHDHKHHKPESPPEQPGGSKSKNKLGYILLGAGLVYVSYSWGKGKNEPVKIGVKVQEAP